MLPVFNCMWERKCIPTEPYSIVTTDILHGIIHGILANIIDNQKEVFSRNKISKQNISIMNCQKEEFKHYSSPSFDIKVGSEEATVDLSRVVSLRKLDVAMEGTAIKLKSGDAMTTWVHACLIVIGKLKLGMP